MNTGDIKRKLRQLKRLEIGIRFGGEARPGADLVWDRFFDLRDEDRGWARYPLWLLTRMDQETYTAVVAEFFTHLYHAYALERGLLQAGMYDPADLARLDLPALATQDDIKARFRQLAKRHHPDAGGDAEQFIALMEAYRRLLPK